MLIRLVDRLRAGEYRLPPWLSTGPRGKAYERMWRQAIAESLGRAQLFVADNVAEYMYCECEQERWELDRDFPNVAPPFPEFWIECNRPTRPVLSDQLGTYDPKERLCKTWGILFRSTTPAELAEVYQHSEQDVVDQRQLLLDDARFLESQVLSPQSASRIRSGKFARSELSFDERAYVDALHGLAALSRGDFANIYQSDVRWVVEALAFAFFDNLARFGEPDQAMGPLCHWVMQIGEAGQILSKPIFGVQVAPGATGRPSPEHLGQIVGVIYTPLLTISLLHCKNVERVREEPAPKLSRAFRRRKGVPLAPYHVLKIQAFRAAAERDGQTGEGDVRRALRLHIVRGHFADYRHGKGLFGRHRNIFWFDSYVRGAVEEGVTRKDYQVEIAKEVADVSRAAHG